MKLPKSFRTEKNLDEKTQELVNQAKLIHKINENKTIEEIFDLASQITLGFGLYTGEDRDPFKFEYVFDDDEIGLNILYTYSSTKEMEIVEESMDIKWNNKGVLDCDFSRSKVCEIRNYISGDWEVVLKNYYKNEIA